MTRTGPHITVVVGLMARKTVRHFHGVLLLEGPAARLLDPSKRRGTNFMGKDRERGPTIEKSSRRSRVAASFPDHLRRG